MKRDLASALKESDEVGNADAFDACEDAVAVVH
jgi:hypothetical protein